MWLAAGRLAMNDAPPAATSGPKPASVPKLLAILLLPALLCAVIGLGMGDNDTLLPLFGAVVALGSLGAGFWCGFGLASRWVVDPAKRVPLGLMLGVVCTVASVVACFAGCIGGGILGAR